MGRLCSPRSLGRTHSCCLALQPWASPESMRQPQCYPALPQAASATPSSSRGPGSDPSATRAAAPQVAGDRCLSFAPSTWLKTASPFQGVLQDGCYVTGGETEAQIGKVGLRSQRLRDLDTCLCLQTAGAGPGPSCSLGSLRSLAWGSAGRG